MPLNVQEAAEPRCPRDFALVGAANQQLTDPERHCLHSVNEYVDYLATIPVDNTPRGQELINLRNQYVGLFHDRAAEVVGNSLSAEELLYTGTYIRGSLRSK